MNKQLVIWIYALTLLASPALSLAETSKLDQMISPVSNPVNFEDPRSQTSLRPIYMYHKAHGDFVTGSGDVQLLALQLRVALTDRLAFLATKDGYVKIDADKNVPDSEGFVNLAGGLQYAFVHNPEEGFILTGGLRYEAPTGEKDVFQGDSDGIISPHISMGKVIGPVNVLTYTALRLGINDKDSDFWDLSLHVDYPIENLYPLFEVNMVHVVDAGNRIGLEHEGFDLVNFGSSGSDGSTVVTAAVGVRYRAVDWLDIGAAYEFAVTDRNDIFDWRVTADLIFKYPETVFN